jgi:hypothetical protein
MNSATGSRVLSLDEAAAYRPQQVVDLSRELAAAKHQINSTGSSARSSARRANAGSSTAPMAR